VKETITGFKEILSEGRQLFLTKNQDYGPSWLVLRLSSLTDQIFIKARRIRSIEEKGVNKVGEDIASEYLGIVNYCIMALIQLRNQSLQSADVAMLLGEYDLSVAEILQLLENKNHDYDEVWREMRISSMTDLILMKLLRIKQIEDNEGQTLISEGLSSQYLDIINYAIFCLIRLREIKQLP
jgi:hypothetical protein